MKPMPTATHRYPNGWFPVACGDEVTPGRIFTGRLAGEDVVVYRTRRGRLRAVHPYCPHLGAHLGHGGRVEGETIVCPFHGFSFGPAGNCVRTPYGQPPPRASLTHVPVIEANGLVFAWHHESGSAPTWEPVTLPSEGFTKPTTFQITSSGHPHDLVENLIDVGHFGPVHNTKINLVSTEPEGPFVRVAVDLSGVEELGFFKERGLHRLGSLKDIRGQAEFTCSGVGIVSSLVSVPELGVQLAQVAALTPEDPGRMHLRLATSARIESRMGAALAPALSHLVRFITKRQVKQDYEIWANRRPIERPKIATGDGPIMLIRRWAQQFYESADADLGGTPERAGTRRAAAAPITPTGSNGRARHDAPAARNER
ncbi:aromatic ring-hydroxylating dioxygenase subunit alpha [Streptomyces sp. LX-29]|uniref:aromatic ring-hydroxylating dioxygenase subunit alpha n=1 Tax=Streptomyces sp. LX-29 TaxID=2900152 RepID=UPI00240E8A60|nr:aromatic ring-hydroxylating dioxygenase subunit alpha [Streptomyces sp. LX-29]WFB11184.1 aromatic ring-hydroxylating dioxygenase subunit alpha [Streptomyces sp. LX-29]